ncbi:MAG: peptidase, partial [Alphaproteobacteria bacterium]|nr:peptidase [Alphaproteobacteria bacterium]
EREGELGTVSSGARADLIAVEGDPLRDISVLEHQGCMIKLIVSGGRIHRNAL